MGYGGILGQATNTYTKDQTLTQAIAALYNLGTDAVPNDVFNILSASALYKTVAPTQQLGSLTEGSIIYLNESGTPVPFYVAKQNYEPDYNTNRTLVVRKYAVMQGQWNSSGVNTYNGSTIDTWFNSTYLSTLDSDAQTAIGTTNIPATSPYNSGVIRLEKGVFALSATELNQTSSKINTEGTVIPITYTILGIASTGSLWTRSPGNSSTSAAIAIVTSGTGDTQTVTNSYKYLPAFTLPSTFTAYLDEPTTGLYDIQNNLLLKLPGVQIETGSYTGTGAYGSNNPNSLTFGFEPKFVIVTTIKPSGSNYYFTGFFTKGATTAQTVRSGGNSITSAAYGGIVWTTWVGNSVFWYDTTSSDNQFNGSSGIYSYLAIG